MMSGCNKLFWILSSIQFIHFAAAFTTDSIHSEDQLIFAHVIFRHGERNIEKSYPNDPYKNESFWIGGFGALTNVGKQEAYELGKYLRKRYRNLIGSDYSPNTVYIQSSDYDRTLMSAQVLAAGMFPPSNHEIWNEDIKWQPVPIHTRPLETELLLPHHISCPRFRELFEGYQSSAEYRAVLDKHRGVIKQWERQSGKSLEKLVEILYLYDTLYVEDRQGFILPEWAYNALKSDGTLEFLANFHLESFTHLTELKKLEAGFLIKEMLDRFKQKSLSLLQPNRSLWIYAAHDLTIINILNSLNLYNLHFPPYASSVHFELYKNGTNLYVQLFYRKSENEGNVPLEIPNCGTKCPLDMFYSVYVHILPNDTEDYETACKKTKIDHRMFGVNNI